MAFLDMGWLLVFAGLLCILLSAPRVVREGKSPNPGPNPTGLKKAQTFT